MQSLFLRMRLVHWVGFTLLILSATFFTSDLIGKAIQYIVALVVLVHDFDEKKWGVDSLKSLASYLQHLVARISPVSPTSIPASTRKSPRF